MACSLGVSSNDLGDNLNERVSAKGNAGMLTVMLAPDGMSLIKKIQGLVGDFEITKRVMMLASGELKRGLYSCSDDASIEAALNATDIALAELEKLSKKQLFNVSIKGVNLLKIEVQCPAEPDGAHGAWIDPHLVK